MEKVYIPLNQSTIPISQSPISPICIYSDQHKVEYAITVTLYHAQNSWSPEPQYVKLEGSTGSKTTDVHECDADFMKIGATVTCVFYDIPVTCPDCFIYWRNTKDNSLILTQVTNLSGNLVSCRWSYNLLVGTVTEQWLVACLFTYGHILARVIYFFKIATCLYYSTGNPSYRDLPKKPRVYLLERTTLPKVLKLIG